GDKVLDKGHVVAGNLSLHAHLQKSIAPFVVDNLK
ncbi:MAG: inositol monophosphatase, partial [Methylophaga sp.]|nr:inositol monophosphatase [Methylophaga sp.]